jgi:hypothetical protein
MSLPKSLSFPNVKNPAVACVSVQYKVSPTSNTTFAPSSSCSFDIPCGQRSTWLNPANTYLSFTVTEAKDDGGHVIRHRTLGPNYISGYSLYSSAGSQQIESVSEYAVLHHAIRDLCSTKDNAASIDTLTYGTDSTSKWSLAVAGVAGGVAVPAIAFDVYAPLARQSAAKTRTSVTTYNIPLISILGTISGDSVYIPVHALNAALRLDINFASALSASMTDIASTANTFSIGNVFLNVEYLTISDTAQSQITQMTNNVYKWSSSRWSSFKYTHTAGTYTNSLVVPARFSSCRSLLATQRISAAIESERYNSINERTRNYLSTYQLRAGSNFVNPKPVSVTGTGIEAVQELRRIFANNTTENMPTLLCDGEFASDTTNSSATATVFDSAPKSFMIGCELESFSQSQVVSGMSSLSNGLILDLIFAGAAPVAAVWDVFIEADSVVTVDGSTGQMGVVF